MANPSIVSSTSSEVSRDGLRILCFDGGGVRGKASLLLLKELMDYVEPGAKPCEYFDLIAGTSTGGLIALMLARLRYSVADAITKYDELAPKIFASVASDRQWVKYGTPLVKEGPAERAFQEIGREGNADDGDVIDEQCDGCKCLVTTVLQDYPKTVIPIRSYHCNDKADPITASNKKWKIWEAARAATAVPVYFRPLEKDGRKFIDAGAGYNNPSVEVLREITEKIPQFKDKDITCFVSIGTGISPPRPSPNKPERRFSLLPSIRRMSERATDLVEYLASIASNVDAAHREMRSRMVDGPYFRFDPGSTVGAIKLADVSRLQGMEDLVRHHIQYDESIEARLQDCARLLKAAPNAFQAPIPELMTPPPTPRPPSTQGEWSSIPELLEIVLKTPEVVSPFLLIFSFSTNFDTVLQSLAQCYERDTPETTQGCILNIVNKFICNLWLTEDQISRLHKSFNQNSDEPVHLPLLAFQQKDLNDNLQHMKNLKEAAATLNYSLASLIQQTKLMELAKELAEALAVLEDNLRRTDPVGECVRWMARNWPRDFLSFPERVKHWVLYSILHAETVDIRNCYYLFYKVAKRSRDIYNFSAMRAIMSALETLEPLRKEIDIEPREFEEMTKMTSSDITWFAQEAKDKNKPYLHSLEDGLVDKPSISAVKLADHRQRIHWDLCKTFFDELKGKTTRLISPHKYAFGRDRVVAFVKQSLIEVKVIDLSVLSSSDHEILKDAIVRYKEKYNHPTPPLWRG